MSEENTRLAIKLAVLFIILVMLAWFSVLEINGNQDPQAFIAAALVIIAIGVSLL